ncbi:SDR family oxidoreductase [Levilactobacillus acidifarinae]|uniref:Oxidoreductase, short chain dehydrogenase reductase family protein n=1 Tax=Levilactobacillus acidifarinae DSM 19394 = JCM 15949 TaxID=1423715 RepID=A0A0R1LJ97_9LACO|nr:oxidoreductase, short chain dehydrogenase reductase family protein [Levilactobacillus acidifarinae DSM 19394]GEO69218.1 oxidoreductase [Levilactobacillus acidifarinae]
MDLSDKVIVIMGASSGMGAATSRLLAQDGAKLVLAARRLDRLQAIQAEFPDAPISIFQADVADYGQVKHVIDETIKQYGRIDVLDNNAGIMPGSPLVEGQRADWQAMIDVNIEGVLNGIAAALPYMVKQKSGHVIATASVGAHTVFPNYAVYSGTKYAVRAIMDGLRMEQAQNNIKTTIVSPGATETELIKYDSEAAAQQAHEAAQAFGTLQPEQIAQSVEFAIGTKANMSVSEILVRPTKQAD